VPCSNTVIGNARHGRKVNFAPSKIPLGACSPKKCIYSVPAQETTKRRAKFGLLPLSDVGAVTKPKREARWNLPGCPKLVNRSQPLVDRSSPYCKNMWRRLLLNIFSDCRRRALVAKISFLIARQICAMVRRWRSLRNFRVLYFQPAACSTFHTCILNSH